MVIGLIDWGQILYIPAAFQQTDSVALQEFIRSNSFGLLVSQLNGEPFATHLPMLLDANTGSSGKLYTHLARSNPQWTGVQGQQVLAIFSGPHAYVSPTWYEAIKVVPTWNYLAVHVYGKARIIEQPTELMTLLERSVETYEASQSTAWQLDSQDSFIGKLLQQIVGLEIEVERIEGKWKISQNQPVERQEKVARALESQDDHNAQAIAALMRERLKFA